MPRLMSVAFTEDAVRARTKTVTRRKGWSCLFCSPHPSTERRRSAMSIVEDAVVAICRSATAHNYGQTVYSYGSAFISDEVTVELSSWPRMQEARRALEAAGYVVTDDNERTLTARPSSVGSVLENPKEGER